MNKTLGIIGMAAIFAAVLGIYAIPNAFAQSASSSGAATDYGSASSGASGNAFQDSASTSAAGQNSFSNAGGGFSYSEARR